MPEVEQLIRSLTLIIDNNDQYRYEQITQAAQYAVLEDMGRPAPTIEDYRQAWRTGDTTGYERAAGAAVADLLSSWLGDLDIDEWWKAILVDVLDLDSSAVRDALGAHYLPEPNDLEVDLADEEDGA